MGHLHRRAERAGPRPVGGLDSTVRRASALLLVVVVGTIALFVIGPTTALGRYTGGTVAAATTGTLARDCGLAWQVDREAPGVTDDGFRFVATVNRPTAPLPVPDLRRTLGVIVSPRSACGDLTAKLIALPLLTTAPQPEQSGDVPAGQRPEWRWRLGPVRSVDTDVELRLYLNDSASFPALLEADDFPVRPALPWRARVVGFATSAVGALALLVVATALVVDTAVAARRRSAGRRARTATAGAEVPADAERAWQDELLSGALRAKELRLQEQRRGIVW